MNDDIVVQLPLWPDPILCGEETGKQGLSSTSKNLHTHWQHPDQLPASITQSPTIMRILDLKVAVREAIGSLDWGRLHPIRGTRPSGI